jgi:hypothetical protein
MKIELTKEEIGIINEMCFGELIEMSKIKNNKFIDKAQVESYIEKIKAIMDKTCIEE